MGVQSVTKISVIPFLFISPVSTAIMVWRLPASNAANRASRSPSRCSATTRFSWQKTISSGHRRPHHRVARALMVPLKGLLVHRASTSSAVVSAATAAAVEAITGAEAETGTGIWGGAPRAGAGAAPAERVRQPGGSSPRVPVRRVRPPGVPHLTWMQCIGLPGWRTG